MVKRVISNKVYSWFHTWSIYFFNTGPPLHEANKTKNKSFSNLEPSLK